MSRHTRTILVAGFQHETNTFAPSKADYANFERGQGFPPMSRGADVLALARRDIQPAVLSAAAEAAGHMLVPVIWAARSVRERHGRRIGADRGEIVEADRARETSTRTISTCMALWSPSMPMTEKRTARGGGRDVVGEKRAVSCRVA